MHDVQYYKSIFDKYGGMMRTTQLAEEKIFYPQREKLIADGYVKQLMVAVDLCLKASLRKYGGWSYDHIFENIIPMMQQEGLSSEDITRIIDVNPLAFLKQ